MSAGAGAGAEEEEEKGGAGGGRRWRKPSVLISWCVSRYNLYLRGPRSEATLVLTDGWVGDGWMGW